MLAKITIGLRIVLILCSSFFVVSSWLGYASEDDSSLSFMQVLERLLMMIIFMGFLSLMITSGWVYQIHRNAQKTGLVAISKNAGSVFWSHFIPVMNLFFPLLVTVEAYRAVTRLHNMAPASKPASASLAWPILWWVLRTLGLLTSGVTLAYIMNMEGNFEVNILFTLTLGLFILSHFSAIVMLVTGSRREVAYVKLWNQGLLQQAATQRKTL